MDDIERARGRGFGSRVGFGQSPALLVVDFTRNFTAPATSLGSDMATEIVQTNRLIHAARKVRAPIYFSTIAYENPSRDAGIWLTKIPGLRALVLGTSEVSQDPGLDFNPSDQVVIKRGASCFFGTTLAQDLGRDGIDTLVIAGCTTSGCVRASAVDSCQHGLRTIVAREATADRIRAAHEQSLVDIDLKYGDVLSVEMIVELFARTSNTLRRPAVAESRHALASSAG